jgi:hypothetical protein
MENLRTHAGIAGPFQIDGAWTEILQIGSTAWTRLWAAGI